MRVPYNIQKKTNYLRMKTNILTLVLLILITPLFSQTNELPKIIPPAPNAANLGKFTEIPVSNYTGIPQIDIPIWTIEQGRIKIPISLSYHAGGIRVSEIASPVGLGWSLNSGGCVSRTVLGKADEQPTGGFLHTTFFAKPGEVGDITTANFNTWYSTIGGSSGNDISSHVNGSIDDQPDMFNLNIPGHSARFVFNRQGVISVIPFQNIKIRKLAEKNEGFRYTSYGTWSSETFISGWEIITEDGIKYTFSDYDKTASSSFSYNKGEYPNQIPTSVSLTANCWYLTEISTPTDTVKFTYNEASYDYDLPVTQKMYYHDACGVIADKIPPGCSFQRQSVTEKKLASIKFSNGTIRFVSYAKERADLIGTNALEKIIVENKNGNIIKQYTFNYSYLVDNTLQPYESINTTGEKNLYSTYMVEPLSVKRRLILNSIIEKDAQNNSLNNGYRFDYFHDIGLPSRLSNLYDHWGYSNTDFRLNPPEPYFERFGNQSINNYYPMLKEASFDYGKQGALYKITYPTGGSTGFEFDAHETAYMKGLCPPVMEKKNGTSLEVAYSSNTMTYNTIEAEFDMQECQNYTGTYKFYYTQFEISEGNNPDLTIEISGIPVQAANMGLMSYYIVDVKNPSVKLWSSSTNGTQHVTTLSGGVYRLYHSPYVPYINGNTGGLSIASTVRLYDWYEIKKVEKINFGGLRISKITINDPMLNKQLIKEYTYQYGTPVSSPVFLSEFMFPTLNNSCWGIVASINSCYPMSMTQGSYIGYKYVTEKSTNISGKKLGKTEYEYLTPEDYPDVFTTTEMHITNTSNGIKVDWMTTEKYSTMYPPSIPFTPLDNRDWLRGKLINEKVYAGNDGINYIGLKETSYEYSKKILAVGRGMKWEKIGIPDETGFTNTIGSFYNIYSGYTFPTKTTTTEWLDNKALTTTTEHVFSEESLLPIKTSTSKSDGSLLHTFLSYPLEYADNSGFVKKLVDNNIVNAPIEKVTAIEKNGSTSITSGIINTYKDNNLGQIDQVMQLETNSPIAKSGFQFSSKTPGTLPTESTSKNSFTPDQRYKSKIFFDSYDSKGNIQQIHKDGDINTLYLWGYGSTLPVVEIKNITKSIIPDALVTEIANHTFTMSTAHTDIDADVSYLKTQLGSLISNPSYMVTFFTYKPLVGITSKTDPRGVTTYYEYDSFNRLQSIKDLNGKILQKFDYHYKQ
jgi:YD repeat-containing protein